MATPIVLMPGFRPPSCSCSSSSSFSSPLQFSTRIAPELRAAAFYPPSLILSASPFRPRSSSSFSRSCKLRSMTAYRECPQPEEGDEGLVESVGVSMEPKYFDIDAGQRIWFLLTNSTPIVLKKKTIISNWKRRLCYFKQRIPDLAIWRGLKLIFLISLLTFPTSHDAVAGTEAPLMNSVPFIGDFGEITTGFASAFLLIFFSELGDKTFFIAALLAARNSGTVVFLGTFTALAAMSVISVIFGRMFHYVDGILPFRLGEADFPIDDIAAVCLLVYFGVTTLLEATSGDNQKSKEEQKEAELVVSEFSGNGAGITAAASTAASTFVLIFVAEWGDKSFFSTIALAAASSPLGVVAGALAGHALATLLAIIGGSLLGNFLSEKFGQQGCFLLSVAESLDIKIVHIPKDERSELDVKSKPCIFVGYGQDEFSYWLYDPVQKEIVR